MLACAVGTQRNEPSVLFKVQDIEKARVLAEENAHEAQQKEDESRQLEQELREANQRVRFSSDGLINDVFVYR